jgi:transcriptional regulator with XRE-family HTH domain
MRYHGLSGMVTGHRQAHRRRAVRKRLRPQGDEFNFAARLRSVRSGLDLTQEAVAHRAGLTAKFISQVENDHSSPTIRVAVRIVEAGLGISLGEFFSGNETPKDDVAKIRSLLSGQPPAVRRRALKMVRALCEE